MERRTGKLSTQRRVRGDQQRGPGRLANEVAQADDSVRVCAYGTNGPMAFDVGLDRRGVEGGAVDEPHLAQLKPV